MAVNTANYNLKKPSQEDFYNIEDHNGNMDIIDTQIKKIETELEGHLGDHEYQNATVNGTQIRLSRQSDTMRLFFYLPNDLLGGNITISLDNGAASLPLKDIDGEQLTILDKGYWEVVDNTSFFTLRPRGGDERGFYGKYTGARLTLTDRVKEGDYIYSNENIELVLADVPTTIDKSTPVVAGIDSVYTLNANYANPYRAPIQRLSNGWFVIFYIDGSNNGVFRVSKDNCSNWQDLIIVPGLNNIVTHCITSKGTTLYLLAMGPISPYSYFYKIDATTGQSLKVGNITITGYMSFIPSCSIVVDDLDVIHIVYNQRYSSSYNTSYLWYAKSTTGGATWTIPSMLIDSNYSGGNYDTTSGYYIRDLTTVILKDGSIRIIYGFFGGGGWNMVKCRKVGSDYPVDIYSWQDTSTEYQYHTAPSATVLSDGTIYIVWAAYNKYTSPWFEGYRIFSYKSTDATGTSWSSNYMVTFNSDKEYSISPIIVSDFYDNIYCIYCHKLNSNSLYQIKMKKLISDRNWGNETVLTTATSDQLYLQACDNYKFFTEPIIIYRDAASKQISFKGTFKESPERYVIPSINNATKEQELIAIRNGALQTHGNDLKRYSGFVSRKSKGWS